MPHTKARILYVEDHQDMRLMMMILLQQAGFGVIAAATIAEAMEVARRTPFDVCIVDIRLPDGDGTELCQRLRQLKPDVAVVYYTGMVRNEDEQRAMQQCGEVFLRKPASVTEIVEAVVKALAQKENQQSQG